MTVAIGQLTTEVVDEGRAGADGATAPRPAPPPWQELERARRAQAELARLAARTRAEGFDG